MDSCIINVNGLQHMHALTRKSKVRGRRKRINVHHCSESIKEEFKMGGVGNLGVAQSDFNICQNM